MRSDLWVIWIAMLALCSSVAFSAGRYLFPSTDPVAPLSVSGGAARPAVLNSAAGLEPGSPSPSSRGAGLSGGPPWPDVTEPDVLGSSMVPPWSDTPDHLEHLAARYYPPPEEEDFPTTPVFDRLATEYPVAHEPSAPAPVAGPPPGDREAGAETEPPAPAGHALSGDQGQPAPVLAPDDGRHDPGAGAGADPWQDIASRLDEDPNLNQWSIGAEVARCREIVRELHALGKALKAPYQLTPWKGHPA